MQACFTIGVLGVRWRIHTDPLPPDVAERLAALWSRAHVTENRSHHGAGSITVGDFHFLPPGATVDDPAVAAVAIPPRADDLPYAMSQAITTASIHRQRGRLLLLHAAGLSSADGRRALALYGPSGAGKSVAARCLGQRLGYLSDETVAVDGNHRVLPYPKPLSIVRSESQGRRKVEYSPDELGLGATVPRAALVALVELRRSPEFAVPRLRPVDLVSGVFTALSQTSSIDLLDAPLDRLARAASQNGGPRVLEYDEISHCVDLLVDLVERPAPAGETARAWRHIPGEPATREPRVPVTAFGPSVALSSHSIVQRSPWTDAIETDGGVLALLGPVPVLLRGIGATIWLHAAERTTVGSLLDQVVAVHGAHPQAEQRVVSTVSELVGAGVLEEA
jgi:hypothetical protein